MDQLRRYNTDDGVTYNIVFSSDNRNQQILGHCKGYNLKLH